MFTIALLAVGGLLAWKFIQKQGGLDSVFNNVLGPGGVGAPAPATAVGTETNPPTLTAPAPQSVIAQLSSGVAIPTLDIAPQYITAMNFYAQRIGAEVAIHSKTNLSAADQLQIQGVVLQFSKADLLDIAYLNGLGAVQDVGGIQSTVLTPPALQKFSIVLLQTAQRMNIPLKPESIQLFQLYSASGNVLPTSVGPVFGAPVGGFGLPPLGNQPVGNPLLPYGMY